MELTSLRCKAGSKRCGHRWKDALRAQGQDPNNPITQADLKQAASQTGLTMDQLLEALEAAQKVT